ncbi:MAG: CxxC-x17-CxxC domain-containing protein [Candidatus Bathyarchaeia archaeon]
MSERKMFKIKCSDCGQDSEVPFEPSGDRPVYCRDCYQKRRRY